MSAEHGTSPIDIFLRSSKELFNPEMLVAEAAMEMVKEEIKKHLEKKIRGDPELGKELKEAVRELLEARALEYAAILRVTATIAKLGIVSVPEEMRGKLTREIAALISRELGAVVEKAL